MTEVKIDTIRFCRICWNSQKWQRPTGEAAKLELGSYVSQYGFGHEEWLFNLNWIIDEYRYGFLQPLSTQHPTGEFYNYEIILYTVAPNKTKLFVGRIKQCQTITLTEANHIYQSYKQNGWLEEMISDLKKINVDPSPFLNNPNPLSIANVRFKIQDLELLDPLIAVPNNHKVKSSHRYQPLYAEKIDEWDSILKLQNKQLSTKFLFINGNLKETERRKRAFQKGIAFDPAHDRLQNALFNHLNKKYGQQNVGYEINGVDLVVRRNDQFTFYEIKMESTVKRCVRLAIGQLLEYAHWPDQNKADKFIVVGKIPANENDRHYLSFLREQYKLPIYYQLYDLTSDTLSPEN
ncbi:MAG: hypothetical protein HZC38_00260 [Chloroflexi bacterium]|nr:hypothetical protein [Chloroflexota bacterium]MBI5711849.1 hypothetical protein [Chloroflexota bacterium]